MGELLMSKPAIKADELSKFYGKQRGIVDLNLEVHEGEIFGFIGPNGAGKSTTIRTLLNLIFPSSGHAEIFGKDVVRNSAEIKHSIGYVPSEVRYYAKMSVRELLAYAARFHGLGDLGRGEELSETFDLDLDRKIDDLSSGNTKKVALVQAMLHSPKLLILDEATSGLDPLIQNRFYDLLLDENRRGATVFFSSHTLGEVERLCKQVAIIKDGKIIANEDVESLRRKRMRRVVFAAEKNAEIPGLSSNRIVDLERDSERVAFLYAGTSVELIQDLSGIELHALRIEEPSLEEVFIHYYTNEGEE